MRALILMLACGVLGCGGPAVSTITYDGRPLDAWLEQLRDRDLTRRQAAEHALGEIGPPAVAGLAKIAEDKNADPKTRGAAMRALALIGRNYKSAQARQDTRAVLRQLARDADPDIRQEANDLLRDIDRPREPREQ